MTFFRTRRGAASLKGPLPTGWWSVCSLVKICRVVYAGDCRCYRSLVIGLTGPVMRLNNCSLPLLASLVHQLFHQNSDKFFSYPPICVELAVKIMRRVQGLLLAMPEDLIICPDLPHHFVSIKQFTYFAEIATLPVQSCRKFENLKGLLYCLGRGLRCEHGNCSKYSFFEALN